MKRSILTGFVLIGFLGGTTAFAQEPVPPPAGDVVPAPVPQEGEKKLEPTPSRHKTTVPDPKKGKRKRPPVKPPTPEPTAPDQPQDGMQ
jgi:hypothetical protein